MKKAFSSVAHYLNGWLRLLRLPNLLTVPGDVLAGVAVMVWLGRENGEVPAVSQVVSACLASLLLYAAGLVDNDLVDQPGDTKERPDRPLPSGTVPRCHAISGFVILVAGAMLFGYMLLPTPALVVETILLISILVYNRLKNFCPIPGGATMGLCRGLNLLLGATILENFTIGVWFDGPILLAGCWTVYIFAVTLLSQRETSGRIGAFLPLFPAMTLFVIAGIYGSLFVASKTMWMMALPLVVAFLLAARSAMLTLRYRTPTVVQKNIGTLIRNLILLQAAACFVWDSRIAIGLLALWPISYFLGRWFYAS